MRASEPAASDPPADPRSARRRADRREHARKLFHVAATLVAVAAAWFLPLPVARRLLIAAAALAFMLDLGRRSSRAAARLFEPVFGGMLRPGERRRLSGAPPLAAGLALTLVLVPLPFAAVGMLHAGLGDAAAAWVGRRWGRWRAPWGVSVAGSASFFVVGFLAGWALPGVGAATAATAALAAAAVEAAPLGQGDNLLVPLAGAAVAWAVA